MIAMQKSYRLNGIANHKRMALRNADWFRFIWKERLLHPETHMQKSSVWLRLKSTITVCFSLCHFWASCWRFKCTPLKTKHNWALCIEQLRRQKQPRFGMIIHWFNLICSMDCTHFLSAALNAAMHKWPNMHRFKCADVYVQYAHDRLTT